MLKFQLSQSASLGHLDKNRQTLDKIDRKEEGLFGYCFSASLFVVEDLAAT